MKVLVCAASKYGATGEIASAVADVLAEKGLEVTVIPPEQAGAIEQFDAVVLGSAVYMGQWMKPARELVERSAAALAARPGWLFFRGPGAGQRGVHGPGDEASSRACGPLGRCAGGPAGMAVLQRPGRRAP